MGQGLEAKDGTWKDLQDFDPEFSAQGQREVDRNINYDCAIILCSSKKHFKHFQAAPLDMHDSSEEPKAPSTELEHNPKITH